MNILLCHNYYKFPGGESEVFEAEIRGLTRMGNETLIFQRQNKDIEKFPVTRRTGLLFSAYYSQNTYRDLRNLIRNEKPRLAIVQNVFPLLSPSVYIALSDADLPVIQAVYNYRLICPSAELFTEGEICERCVGGNTIHAVIHKCYRGSYAQSAWYASIIGLHRHLGTFAHRITSFMVPDAFLGNKLAEGGIPSEKIWRNPNPFFVQDYEPRSSHNGYVLFVGRLVRQKGILTLLNAMLESRSTSRLIIVGQGELADTVKARISDSSLAGRVDWLGPRWGDEITRLIRDCAAVVIPSEWYDNLPMILCRANAMGKPVIASRINGIPEYIREGENGYLFEPGDAATLSRLIDRILQLSPEEYSNLSSRARLFAEQVLDYPIHYANLMTQIRSLGRGNSQ